MNEKQITIAYFDEMDQVRVRQFVGHCGYDVLGDALIKVWEGRETLIVPVDRLISLTMHI